MADSPHIKNRRQNYQVIVPALSHNFRKGLTVYRFGLLSGDLFSHSAFLSVFEGKNGGLKKF